MHATDPLNILLISLSKNDPFGGASRVFHLLEEGLGQLGHQTRLLHREELMGLGGSKIVDRFFLPQAASRAAKRFSPEQYDVVFSSSGMLYPLFNAMGPGRTRRVHQLHGAAFYDQQATLQEGARGHARVSPLYRHVTGEMPVKWDLLGARASDGVIVNSLRDKDYLVDQGIDEQRIDYVPLPVHSDVLRLRSPLDRAPARVRHSAIWFGSWTDRKGFAYLPRAWKHVLARFPGATLTIGGTGRSREEITSAFAGMDTSGIRVLGRIGLDEQVREFERHAAFLFPSLSEGFGFALLEAMACGLPSITTLTGLGGDLIRHGESAIIIPPASSIHLASSIIDLFADSALQSHIGARARQNAERYTLQRTATGYASFFHRLLDDR